MSRVYDALKRAQEEQERPTPGPFLPRPVVPHEADRPLTDAYRNAYEQIVQRVIGLPEHERPKVLLFASAVSGDGTSTVARTFAGCLIRSGQEHVVLVDANLRAPSQHLALGVERSDGLAEVLSDRKSLASVLRSGFGPGFALLTSGRPANDPTQLLGTEAVQRVFQELRDTFDVIVVDGPPITKYADAALLGSFADATVLVVKAEATRMEVVEQAKRSLDETGIQVLGAVLNRRHYHIPNWVYSRL